MSNKDEILEDARQYGDALRLDLLYPQHNTIKAIIIGLMDVRAVDDIRIEFDYGRDGWVIKQAQVFEWDVDDERCGDPQWKEVAFIRAWGSEL